MLISQEQESNIPLLYLDSNEEKKLSPCLIQLNRLINWFSLLVSTYLISNTVLLKFKYLDYISVDDKILYPLFGIGVLYFICSLPSLYCCLKRVCIKSYCLYFLYMSFIGEGIYGMYLYVNEPKLFENFELKLFLLLLVFFHLIYLLIMTFLKYAKC